MPLSPFQTTLRSRMSALASCKVGTFEELEDDCKIELTKEEMSQLKVEVYDSSELKSPTQDFPRPAPSVIFILVRDGKRYLVNTEGYDYARYIIRIRTITTVGVK